MSSENSISMEYEARVMVSEHDYYQVKEEMLSKNKPHKDLVNENIYFDTKDLFLTNNHIVLRLRTIDRINHELTLKIKGDNGDIEINNPVNEEEYKAIIKSEQISTPNILEELKKRKIDPKKLGVVAQLLTYRTEIDFGTYLLVIDKNQYNGKIDFNIEVESTSKEDAVKYLKKVIKPFDIKYKKDYISKSRRAILKL